MNTLIQLIKDFLVPGSISFLTIGLAVGVALLYRRGAAALWGRRWLTALAALYWGMGTPLGADALSAGLSRGYGSLADAAAAQGATAIVVLTGGSMTYRAGGEEINTPSGASAFRALETARLYRVLQIPLVIVSGGVGDPYRELTAESEATRAALIEAGVPPERIVLETASRTTREQALNLLSLLREKQVERFVLVTSPTHMRRALAAFQAVGLRPIPSVSARRSEGLPEPAWAILPTNDALLASQSAMREYLALIYYWSRGWLAG